MRPRKSCASSSSSASARSACPARSRLSSPRFSRSSSSRTARRFTPTRAAAARYIVAKDNLGETPALIAAGALLIDYVLTVAVSIAAGVAAITSAFPEWHLNRVEMALGFVVIITLGNLRGIRESGRIFALPTYFFVVSLLALIAAGAWRALNGSIQPVEVVAPTRTNRTRR